MRKSHYGKPRKRAYIAAYILFVVLSYLAARSIIRANHVDLQFQVYAPTLPKAYAYVPTPTPTPSEHDLIVAYIKEVFGKEANNAFKILSCENPSLNSNAQGHNTNGTTDTGVMQIDSIWASPIVLTDYKTNIDIGYQIFKRDGWKEWTCEYKYHVLEK